MVFGQNIIRPISKNAENAEKFLNKFAIFKKQENIDDKGISAKNNDRLKAKFENNTKHLFENNEFNESIAQKWLQRENIDKINCTLEVINTIFV